MHCLLWLPLFVVFFCIWSFFCYTVRIVSFLGSVVVESMFIVTPIVGFCNCSIVGSCNCFMFCCALLCAHPSYAIILMGNREKWLLCFICLPGASWLLCGSSSWCHGLVCSLWLWYSKIGVKRPLSKRPKIGFHDQLSLNIGQKYCITVAQFEVVFSSDYLWVVSHFLCSPWWVNLIRVFLHDDTL